MTNIRNYSKTRVFNYIFYVEIFTHISIYISMYTCVLLYAFIKNNEKNERSDNVNIINSYSHTRKYFHGEPVSDEIEPASVSELGIQYMYIHVHLSLNC